MVNYFVIYKRSVFYLSNSSNPTLARLKRPLESTTGLSPVKHIITHFLLRTGHYFEKIQLVSEDVFAAEQLLSYFLKNCQH